jgi:diaminohydroxyphosphoribosylaminopyrimidine deaminase/5-amino-6-(5-phosphoribosylamino)uracil reductase
MQYHLSYMKRTFDLALLGRGQVCPNPMVGCVIVHDDKIIGEGYHQKYGEAHAEVNAIAAVQNKDLLKEATVYVNLEPCSHFGKTPPCADLLIKHQVKKVIVCNLDSNPLVAGKGIQKLRSAGIEVEVGVLEEEGKNLNKRFFTFMEHQRPYIVLKWAETADGFIAREDYNSRWISNELSRMLVHKWRTEETAIWVGKNTALYDNPQLNARNWTGKQPVRVVIDSQLTLPTSLHLFDQSQTTLCYNLQKSAYHEKLEYIQLNPTNFVKQVVTDLYSRKLQSVLVEGGAMLLNSLLEADLWDEIRLFKGEAVFGKGIAAPRPKGKLFSKEHLQTDTLYVYRK